MLVPDAADGFRDYMSSRQSLDDSEGVSFHTVSLSGHRCVRLFLKKLGSPIGRTEIREELEA